MIQIPDETEIRRWVREELARPELIHQRTVEAIVGLPRRDFIDAAHRGAFPSTKERRLIIAKTADVIAYFEARITARVTPAADGESAALARVGARRVG